MDSLIYCRLFLISCHFIYRCCIAIFAQAENRGVRPGGGKLSKKLEEERKMGGKSDDTPPAANLEVCTDKRLSWICCVRI